MPNFFYKLNAEESCVDIDTCVLPRPALPVTPLASFPNRDVEPQTKRNCEMLTGTPPTADGMERASEPRVPIWVMLT